MGNILKATHDGILSINSMELNVAVLEDGTRVITHSAVFKALGREARGNARVIGIPSFMDAKNLQPLVGGALEEKIGKIKYLGVNDKITSGYDATILPLVCDLYLKARELGIIKQRSQLETAQKAEVLVRSLAKIGITALVDEATGYQYDREKDELQTILKGYISEELLPWQKKFPDVFYKELFRLNSWNFNVHGIKKRPGVIGTWTKKLVYEQLPTGVLKELENNVPKSPKGNNTVRLHQLLTEDIGNAHLKAQINQIVTLFQLSDNMKDMWHNFKKLKERQRGQLDLPFDFDDQGHTVEPIDKTTLSAHNKSLKKALDFNHREDKKTKKQSAPKLF